MKVAPLLLALTACASSQHAGGFPSDDRARPATDTPAQFSGVAASGEGTCQSPLTDPRNGAQLRFVRSVPGRGDYEVAAGQYGARSDELLRIDCRTGRAVGLVPR